MLETELQYAYTVREKLGGKHAADFKHRSVCVFTAFREQMFTVRLGLSLVESLALFHCAWLPSLPVSM